MSINTNFLNFPFIPPTDDDTIKFRNNTDVGQWDWNTSASNSNVGSNGSTGIVLPTMQQPSVVADILGGGIVLNGSLDPQSAVQYDFVQAQKIGANIQFNELGKTWQFMWKVQLSSAANSAGLVGCFGTNTNLMGSNIVNGFGFMCNQGGTGAPGASAWYPFLSNGSGTQFSGYNILPSAGATDTNVHTMAVQLITDPGNLGAGQMTFYIDGVGVGQINNNGAANFPQVVLRNSFAFGNASAAASTMSVFRAGAFGPSA